MKGLESVRELVRNLNGIDDVMFQKLTEDLEVCQEMLQILQSDSKLRLLWTKPQCYLRNVGTRSVIVDALCEDAGKKLYGIEMQKEDKDDHQRRVRYIGSNLDTSVTEKGIDFCQIPDIQMIYLSKFDVFGKGKTVYRVNRMLDELGEAVDNGYRETYINAAIDDGSQIAELMRYLKNTKGNNEHFPHLSARVRYLREEGEMDMCKSVEDYAERRASEAARETARNLFKKGASFEMVSDSVTNLTKEEALAIYEEVTGTLMVG